MKITSFGAMSYGVTRLAAADRPLLKSADAATEQSASPADGGASVDTLMLTERKRPAQTVCRQAADAAERMRQQVAVMNMESENSSSNAISDSIDELAKMLETARRISNGDKVPPEDEGRLMEYSHVMYQSAVIAAMMKKNTHPEEYDSVFDEDEEQADDAAAIQTASQHQYRAAPPAVEDAETSDPPSDE